MKRRSGASTEKEASGKLRKRTKKSGTATEAQTNSGGQQLASKPPRTCAETGTPATKRGFSSEPDVVKPVSDAGPSGARTEVGATTARELSALQTRVSEALEAYEARRMPREIDGLLVELKFALLARGVARGVSDLPRAPKLLLHASCDAAVLMNATALQTLCNCLLLYTRGSGSAAGAGGPAGRARSWALGVIERLLENGCGNAAPSDGCATGAPIGEAGDDEEHCLPRDAVDSASIEWLVSELERRLCRAGDRGMGTLSGTVAVRNVLRDLSPLLRAPELRIDDVDVVPVVNKAVVAAGRMSCNLVAVDEAAHDPFPKEFIDSLLGQGAFATSPCPDSTETECKEANNPTRCEKEIGSEPKPVEDWSPCLCRSTTELARVPIAQASEPLSTRRRSTQCTKARIYNRLDVDAKSVCLRFCRRLWDAHVAQLRSSLFSKSNVVAAGLMSFDDELSAVASVARAAAQELHLHWELIDSVFLEMEDGSEPFSPRHWCNRGFSRAVHFAVANEIERICESAGADPDVLLELAPIYRRFDRSLRPLVSAILAYGGSVCFSTAGLEALYSALSSLTSLRGSAGQVNDANSLDNAILLSVEAQAVVLVFETYVQRIVTSAVAVLASPYPATEEARRSRILAILGRVLCAIDEPRDSVGGVAEEPVEWLARSAEVTMSLGKVLPVALNKHHGNSRTLGLWKGLNLIDSMMASVIVGAGVGASSFYHSDEQLACEVLRMCESAKVSLAPELEKRIQLEAVFDAASRSLRKSRKFALKDMTHRETAVARKLESRRNKCFPP